MQRLFWAVLKVLFASECMQVCVCMGTQVHWGQCCIRNFLQLASHSRVWGGETDSSVEFSEGALFQSDAELHCAKRTSSGPGRAKRHLFIRGLKNTSQRFTGSPFFSFGWLHEGETLHPRRWMLRDQSGEGVFIRKCWDLNTFPLQFVAVLTQTQCHGDW